MLGESAVAVLESAHAQATGAMLQLSVQQAAECTPAEANAGCEGGWPLTCSSRPRPGTGCARERVPDRDRRRHGSSVQRDAGAAVLAAVAGRQGVVGADRQRDVLFFAAQRDVVSVAIDASGDGFYSYAYGVYSSTFDGAPDCSSDALDHAVVVVGYGAQLNGTLPFYIVRNSWGAAAGAGAGQRAVRPRQQHVRHRAGRHLRHA